MPKGNSDSRGPVRSILTTMLVIISFLVVSTYFLIDEILLSTFGDTTVYSNEYSDGAFNGLEIGSSQESVTALLGPPFESYIVDDNGAEVEIWVYSKSKSDSHFRKKLVHFKNGLVAKKIDEVVID